VSVTTRLTGIDDRVDASVEDRRGTGQAPKRVSRRDKKEPCCKNRQNHRVARDKENKE
jgi:hypothetical protein